MGFSRQEYWSGLPFPSPVDHILSELSTMTHPSCVALHGMAHSFTEFDRAIINVISWLVFCDCGFHSVCPVMDNDKRLVEASWWGRLTVGQSGSRSDGWGHAQFSLSVMSDSLQPCGQQHARLPCPSLTPGAYSNSCPSSWWCHPTFSSSVPFSSWLQSLQASGSFPVNQFFTSGGQSIGVSASASVLPMNIQDWFPLGWTGWISWESLQETLKNLLQHHSFKSINS